MQMESESHKIRFTIMNVPNVQSRFMTFARRLSRPDTVYSAEVALRAVVTSSAALQAALTVYKG